MDVLYDNLENYQDEKIIDELKNENKELKTKLEEYSSAMTRLQKDFDKLNSEYKKLEMNYSSLLKTARAEIERKAEMIKSLNTEKDLLIIKTLQSSGKKISNTRRFFINNSQQSKKSHDIDTKRAATQPEPPSGNQNEEKRHINERHDKRTRDTKLSCLGTRYRINLTHTQSEDTTSGLKNKPNVKGDDELMDTKNDLRYKLDRSKENITNETRKDVMKRRGGKITNRRKSMPLCSNIEPTFSSDDDFEALNLKNIRKSPVREDTRHYDKYRSRDRFSSKDKFYSNNINRFIDHGKHDRYESNTKYTKHSAENNRSKYTKDHPETHKSRIDYTNSRQRAQGSPPTDRYNRSKSRDRRTFEREHFYDKQKYSSHNYDKSAHKHKIRNELEEPTSKRYKTDQNKKASIEENISINDREHGLRGSFTKQDFIEPTSCQSPDYVNIESTIPQQVVKEIKHTAVTPLEDPRVSSKKYTINENEGKTVLSTVVSEDFDIKPVNVSSWDIPNKREFMLSPTVPTKRLNEETDKHFVNEIYMDFDKPLLNDSLESGEIQSLKGDNTYYTKCSDRDKIYENKKINKDQSRTLNSLTVIDSNKTNPAFNKLEISKRKTPDKISNGINHEDFDLLSKKQNSTSDYCNENKKHEIEKHDTVRPTSRPAPNTENVIDEQYKNNDVSKMNTILPENTLTAVSCTLADDLELSDEASETRDIQNDAKKSKKILPKDKPLVGSLDLQEHDIPFVNDENINSKPKEKSKPRSLKKVTKDSSQDTGKSRKNKKKTELKDASSTESKEQKVAQTLTKLKSKPAISNATKHKFSDLFGDSSSLITPDDLGIPPPDIQLPLTGKYVSIFDNTQDAVDLNVEDINKAQSNASKASAFPTMREDQANDNTIIEKAGNDAKKVLACKDLNKNATANNLPENKIYEKTTTNNDSEIVKTVIISTGVQPKFTSESNLLQDSQKCNIERTEEINDDKANIKTCVLNTIKALATSTPQKTEHISTSLQDSVSDDASKISENINLPHDASNASNPNEISNEVDVPDIRLFVRRRRKFIKKP